VDDDGWGSFFETGKKKKFKKPIDFALEQGDVEPEAKAGSNDISPNEVNENGNEQNSFGESDIEIIVDTVEQPAETASNGTEAMSDQMKALKLNPEAPSWDGPAATTEATPVVGAIGRGYIVAKTRRRITDDGGRSILATEQRF
jgi:hypothetical protein